ncbi:MAG TPA: DNA polymerase I, partial [Planctomycetaceae bacterium]|nr:DNA polymerase I [Planctomycetaceae bacterium]
MRESLYLIDLYSLIFQVFHAIRDEMSSPDGRPTNAVYGFTRDLITILKEKKPTYLVGAMDSSGPAERNVIYEAYKANRSEMPDDLRPQIPMIGQVLEGFGIPVIEYPGWEADDVIATLVRMAVEREIDVAVITSDKDVRQLLGPHVRMYNMRKRTYMGVAELHADWGIEPGQVVDFQALVGDTVDNIPGVPGIGPKTAATLLNDYRTLDEVLANADKVKGAKARENLKQFADQARISRELARLKVDLPLEVDWERAQAGRINYPRLLELFTEFGFRRFIEDVAALLPEPPPKAGIAPTLQASATLTREWRIVDTPELLAEFAQQFTQQQRFCLDLETTNIDAVRADIVGWAISWEEGHGYYIPVQAPPGQRTLDAKLAIDTLRPHLERTDIQLVNQNVKYDLLVLRRAGIRVGGLGLDPMVGSYLLDSGARSHGQDELSKRYLGHKMIPITDLIGTGKNQCRMCDVDVVRVAEYAVEDAEIAWRLAERIERDLKSEGLWDLYWEIERPLIDVLVAMESNGVRVRSDVLAEQSADVSVRLEQIEQEIYAEAGREFNIASPLHLRDVLFKEQGLPVLKRTKTGPSTDQDVLERLALLHPLPAKIIAHRQLAKLKNTYLDALPGMINPETGKIHASFNQTTAATGRLSSSDPNLQNIPIRTAEGRRVRQAFVPSEDGWQLLCADYSQIELRMLAHYSGDAALIEAFQQGADIHTAVAAEIYGVEPDVVTSEMRTIA